ncbi:MAG: EamA family transporter [bacterium]
MNPFTILLVLTSTFLHAAWNLMAKNGKSEHNFFLRMQFGIIIIGLIPFALSEFFTGSFPINVWIYVAISGIFGGIYYLTLGNAYKASDFTIVYPVARSLPVLIMGLVDLLRGRTPTFFGWLGMFLVTFGCVLSPLYSIKEIHLKRYINKAILWIFLTAIGTVGYSTFDKLSSEIVKQGSITAARYCYLFFTFSGIFYIILHKLTVKKTNNEMQNERGWIKPTLGGIFSYSAYWLVLWAYQLVKQVSYVVTFRQFSIVIGAIIAFILHREKAFALRIIAISAITLGLVIIALLGK